MKKYGVDSPIKNKEVLNKIKQTCMEKYGVVNPSQNIKIQEKIKRTLIEKYGVDHPSKIQEVQEKRKHRFIEKYGVIHPAKSIEAKEIRLKKHQFFCQVEEIKIENNQFKVHCKNHNCVNSKEKGGWFVPTSIQIHNRMQSLEDDNGIDGSYFYCSQECKDACPLFNLKGDPKKDIQLPYTQEQLQTFRLEVLTRDNYICQYCGGVATVVHHERPVKLEPFFSLDPDFGWACCEKCHYEKGHPKGTDCSTGNLAAKVCRPIKKKETTSQ